MNLDKPKKQNRKPQCNHCGAFNHYSFQCFSQRKKIAQIGKYGKQWQLTRETWFKHNSADVYYCYICKKALGKRCQLDHIQSRARHPELRYNLDNLAPICNADNKAKGSLSLEQYLARRGKIQ